MKQRLEAAQEGVSTEDGSSSVTSGLDEDQAAQADMMMRRLVWVCVTSATILYVMFVFLCFLSCAWEVTVEVGMPWVSGPHI